MKESTNKIAQRYRQMIIDAFVGLAHTMPYDEITVLRIVQEADVSRQTFYRHFKTKEDILSCMMDSLIAVMSEKLSRLEHITIESALLEYFRFWIENKDFLQIVYNGHLESWLLLKYNEAMQELFQILRPLFPPMSDAECHMIISFLMGGLYQMKRDWYESDYKETPESMAKLLSGMVFTFHHPA